MASDDDCSRDLGAFSERRTLFAFVGAKAVRQIIFGRKLEYGNQLRTPASKQSSNFTAQKCPSARIMILIMA